MADRKPLVLSSGLKQQIQTGDILDLATTGLKAGTIQFMGKTGIVHGEAGILDVYYKSATSIAAGDGLALTSTGIRNTTLGISAGLNVTSGNDQTALGYRALHLNSTGNGNIALGSYAGAYYLGSNKFFLNNYDTTSEALDLTNSLLVGTFNATPMNQVLQVNAGISTIQQFTSTLADGTAPFSIVSTTKVSNLNVDRVDDLHASAAVGVSGALSITPNAYMLHATESNAITIAHLTTAGNIHLPSGGTVNQILKNSGTAGTGAWGTVTENAGALAQITTLSMNDQLTNSLADGTAPFVITSGTKVSNLNVDKVDDVHVASLTSGRLLRYNATGTQIESSSVSESSGALSGITTLSMNNQLTNSLADGTAPFLITSSTLVSNLNADLLDGSHASAFALSGHSHAPSAGADTTAIHDNVAAEINAITEKVDPVVGDFVLIEDSEDSWNKKKVALSNMLGPVFKKTENNVNVTAGYTVDTVPITSGDNSIVGNIEWNISIYNTAQPPTRYFCCKVVAFRTPSGVPYTLTHIVESTIAMGITVEVDVSGSDAILKLTYAGNVNYSLTRINSEQNIDWVV